MRTHIKFIHYIFVLFSIIIVATIGCSKGNGDDYFRSNQNPYFPLMKGNYWKYYNSCPEKWENDTLLIEIVEYGYSIDKWFAKANTTYYRRGEKRNNWTFYWTYGKVGEICVYSSFPIEKTDIPSIYYDTQSDTGKKWTIKSTFDAIAVKIEEKYNMITIGNNEFKDCIKYYIFSMGYERDEYLVKGVGMVQAGNFILCDYHLN
jgi:hypothetical protein